MVGGGVGISIYGWGTQEPLLRGRHYESKNQHVGFVGGDLGVVEYNQHVDYFEVNSP